MIRRWLVWPLWLVVVIVLAGGSFGAYSVNQAAIDHALALRDCLSARILMDARQQRGDVVRQEDWDKWRAMCTPPQAPAPVPGPSTTSPTPIPPSDPVPYVQPCKFYANMPAKAKEHSGSFGPKRGLLVTKPMSRLTAVEAREEFMTALSKDCMLLAVWSVHFGARALDVNQVTSQYVSSDVIRRVDLAELRSRLNDMDVSLRELPAGKMVLTVTAEPGKIPQVHEVKTAYSKPSQILVFTDRDGTIREVRVDCYGQPLLDGSKDPTRRFYPDN